MGLKRLVEQGKRLVGLGKNPVERLTVMVQTTIDEAMGAMEALTTEDKGKNIMTTYETFKDNPLGSTTDAINTNARSVIAIKSLMLGLHRVLLTLEQYCDPSLAQPKNDQVKRCLAQFMGDMSRYSLKDLPGILENLEGNLASIAPRS